MVLCMCMCVCVCLVCLYLSRATGMRGDSLPCRLVHASGSIERENGIVASCELYVCVSSLRGIVVFVCAA